MSDTVIKVENLSKKYRLGTIGTGTLSHDLNRWWASVRGKEDPFSKVGEQQKVSFKNEDFWALRDLNFNIKQGKAFGIIGKNGAGKSTLLKLLSRVTTPTTGQIKVKGRIASLLEVGTGFHPELTGRENIFLNGAILGMTKREIKSKLDEIVEFSGVAQHIDTPVKRYSSGMYVRLAFAVAAHLEPEILIVDEVLAVGDAEFQKRCLGKMGEVAGEGRTVLFVSHNMTAVKNLCSSVVYLSKGKVKEIGPTEKVINSYLAFQSNSPLIKEFDQPENAPGNNIVRVKRLEVCPRIENEPITIHTPIDIEFEFWNNKEGARINLSMALYTINEECVFNVVTDSKVLSKGIHKGICSIPANLLNDNNYTVSMMLVENRSVPLFFYEKAVAFEVNENRTGGGWHGKWPGVVRPNLNFQLK
jgi:lipopolysaccharide transport system ATP-binding protein